MRPILKFKVSDFLPALERIAKITRHDTADLELKRVFMVESDFGKGTCSLGASDWETAGYIVVNCHAFRHDFNLDANQFLDIVKSAAPTDILTVRIDGETVSIRAKGGRAWSLQTVDIQTPIMMWEANMRCLTACIGCRELREFLQASSGAVFTLENSMIHFADTRCECSPEVPTTCAKEWRLSQRATKLLAVMIPDAIETVTLKFFTHHVCLSDGGRHELVARCLV
jgi:hypothetical protein